MWASAASIAIACVVKSNALIMCIAMVIYALICFQRSSGNAIKGISYIVAAVVTILVINPPPYRIITQMTDCSLDQGISSYYFVAMGLQNDGDSPGWFNGYNYGTYEDNQYITELQAVQSKAEIKNRIAIYKADKLYGFRFFTSKIASMWTEPIYQSFWINQIRDHRVVLPGWVCKVMSERGNTATANIMGFFQIFVFGGTVLWLLFEKEEYFIEGSLFILSFVGGYLFHLFWEAKSQYSITYFVLLIPCAVMGFGQFIKAVNGFLHKNEAQESFTLGWSNRFAVVVAIVTAISFGLLYSICGQGG